MADVISLPWLANVPEYIGSCFLLQQQGPETKLGVKSQPGNTLHTILSTYIHEDLHIMKVDPGCQLVHIP